MDVARDAIVTLLLVTAPLMLVDLYSPKSTYDGIFLANYAYINLVDELTRVPGIARVQVFGAGQYAMRCWVKRLKNCVRRPIQKFTIIQFSFTWVNCPAALNRYWTWSEPTLKSWGTWRPVA